MNREKAVEIVGDVFKANGNVQHEFYGFEQTFEEWGYDSLDVVKLCQDIESKLQNNAMIKNEDIAKLRTFDDLVRLVETYE